MVRRARAILKSEECERSSQVIETWKGKDGTWLEECARRTKRLITKMDLCRVQENSGLERVRIALKAHVARTKTKVERSVYFGEEQVNESGEVRQRGRAKDPNCGSVELPMYIGKSASECGNGKVCKLWRVEVRRDWIHQNLGLPETRMVRDMERQSAGTSDFAEDSRVGRGIIARKCGSVKTQHCIGSRAYKVQCTTERQRDRSK